SRLDYFWPSFENIGEQAVKNKELYVDSSNPDGEFGYVPRYSEYKFNNDMVSGEFRDTLKYWHLAREFANEPSLNEDFIKSNPSKRIFATDEASNHLLAQCYHDISAVRKMQKFATPHI